MPLQNFSPKHLDWIRKNLKIAVIHGGDKSKPGSFIYENHNPRSSKTYESVAHDIANALKESGFSHVSVLPEDIDLPHKLRDQKIDFVLTNSGGLQGYDPMCHLPSTLEMLGIPYVGHSPMKSGILDNKHLFKYEIDAAGIPTAPFVTIGIDQDIEEPKIQGAFDDIDRRFGYGFIVKPVSGRASVNVEPVFERAQLNQVIDRVRQITANTVMVEPFLNGREFVVAVAGEFVFRDQILHQLGNPLAFSITERLLEDNEPIFTSMDVKPITQDRLVMVEDNALRRRLSDLGQRIFSQFDLHTLVRVDLRMDHHGNIYVLETNPKPDLMRPHGDKVSLVCHGLAREGMSYTDLIQSLVFNRLCFLKANRPKSVAHCLGGEFDEL